MNITTSRPLPLLAALFSLLWAAAAPAESERWQCAHAHAAPPTGADSAYFLKYAPSREIKILHLLLDVTPDFKARSIAAQASLRFEPIGKPCGELKLDAIDLDVSTVSSSVALLGWQATARQVIVTFAEPVPVGREATVTIGYRAQPRMGLYFRTPEMGYKPEDVHLWSQGEPIEARHWFPCFDSPNSKFTSEVVCRVPEGMTVLSNGRLVSSARDPGTGLLAVRWLQDKPHANYLIALCAGYFKKVEDKYRDIPLAFHTPASQIAQATNTFRETRDMMEFFEQELGVPYPWAKYDQVCVDDFGWGGMENTTLTVLNDRTLFTDASENLRESTGLVAHELAHQWFGDLVTCKDWSHLWLNEGFATYYEGLYQGRKEGPDMLRYVLHQRAQGIIAQANDTNAIVRRDFNHPEEQFGYLAYPKGSWVLHMLRCQLGDDLFRRCIKTYLERHQFGNVTTEDLNQVVEELSGRSFDQFFDQYVYHAHHPELTVSYSWDERAKLAKLSIQQVQKLGNNVLLFNVPLPVRFKTRSGVVEQTVQVREKAEDFYFPLREAPETVRIDPGLTVLGRIKFDSPVAMLRAQLADRSDMLGRLLAVAELSGRKEELARLKEALNTDPFHGVRQAAATAIRAIQTDEALAALLASTSQPDARVRRQVMAEITGFYSEASYASIQRLLAEEKNPEIQGLLITALGAYAKPEVPELLAKFLNSTSYRGVLADAAMGGMRAQDDAGYLNPLLEAMKTMGTGFTTGVYTRGLETLAYLARHETNRDAVREFLLAQLQTEKKRVLLSAISALGTLGDPRAIAPLEKYSTLPRESLERTAAERAVASLREQRKPAAETGTLRAEVLSLQKENRELRKDLDEVKKKLDVIAGKAGRGSPSGKPKK